MVSCGEPAPPIAVKLQVSLVNETDTRPIAYTNDTAQSFRATISGGTPQTFALYRGTDKIADLAGTGETKLVTTNALAPGTYEFTARATLNGYVYSSEVRTVKVDRTPPKILSEPFDGRHPDPGANDVWVGDDVLIVFTEPIDPSTVTTASVQLARAQGVNAGDPIPANMTLVPLGDGDASGIILKIDPIGDFSPLPVVVSVILSGSVKDLAGNALNFGSTAWQFTVPAWRVLGNAPLDGHPEPNTPATWPVVVLDREDDPVVAWEEKAITGETRMFVRSWSRVNNGWAPLGQAIGPVEVDSTGPAPAHAMVMNDAGDPIVAWRQTDAGSVNIFANIWSTAGWEPLGGGISAKDGATPSGVPSLAASGSKPYLAFHEEGTTSATDVFVYQFDGGGWVPVAPDPIGKTDDTNSFRYPCIGVTSSDPRPVVAYSVSDSIEAALLNKATDPDKFEVLGGGRLNADSAGGRIASSCSMAVSGNDPWIAWDQTVSSTGTGVFLARHTSGQWNPSALGTSDANTASSGGDLELRGLVPYVAVRQGSDVLVKKYEGTTWSGFGPSFLTLVEGSTSLSHPSLSIRGEEIAVAWTAVVNGERKVFVAKYNR